MTGLLGCRFHRLPGRQFTDRSVIPAIHFHVSHQSQDSASRSNQYDILACDRSRTGPLRHKQRMRLQSSLGTKAAALATHTQAEDLLIVGPGVLGSYAGMLWQQHHPAATVTGQTNSTTNHKRYSSRTRNSKSWPCCRSVCSNVPVQVATNEDPSQNKGQV